MSGHKYCDGAFQQEISIVDNMATGSPGMYANERVLEGRNVLTKQEIHSVDGRQHHPRGGRFRWITTVSVESR